MANFKIVPYEKLHGDQMVEFGLNHKLMDIDASYTETRIDTKVFGLSFTLLADNTPILSGGIIPLWDGVAEGWVIATNEMWNHPIAISKAIKKDFARVAKEHNIKRVQSGIRKDFKEGIRFAEWLGLEREGLMKNWGFDGSDQYLYARIF